MFKSLKRFFKRFKKEHKNQVVESETEAINLINEIELMSGVPESYLADENDFRVPKNDEHRLMDEWIMEIVYSNDFSNEYKDVFNSFEDMKKNGSFPNKFENVLNWWNTEKESYTFYYEFDGYNSPQVILLLKRSEIQRIKIYKVVK
jgi:hypothetical protein